MSVWYYELAGQSVGPVERAELDRLAAAGTITPTTLVWTQGMPGWRPFRDLAPAPDPAEGAPDLPPAAPWPADLRDGPPWETTGGLEGLAATVRGVLVRPSETFARMRCEGGLGKPLLFYIFTAGAGYLATACYDFLFQKMGITKTPEAFAELGPNAAAIGFGAMLVMLPIILPVAVFLQSAILHLMLMIVGGARKPFETTFRVACYSAGATTLFCLIPGVGALVGSIWMLVAQILGLAKAHETTPARTTWAVLLPGILACICCFAAFALMFNTLSTNPEFQKFLKP
jgi:hypothetical protein